ncbi:MAG: DNA repair protein RecN, partial [Actinomycetota bacterium]
MIRLLEIRDLVVIERAELEPAAGLTVVTGETGAGKSVLAQALELLAGGAADARAVRPGAGHALVQATLRLPDGFWDGVEDDDPAAALRDIVEDEREVVVARRVPAEGRARAFVDGQAAPREAVASLVGALVRFSGQHQ